MMLHRIVVRIAVVACALATFIVAPGASAKPPGSHDQISYRGWTTAADFASGTFDGAQPVAIGDGAITFGTPVGTFAYDDPFDSTTQTTATTTTRGRRPCTRPASRHGARSSWARRHAVGNLDPGRDARDDHRRHATKWYVLGRWTSQMPSEASGDIHRTSLGGQGDADGTVAIDTFLAAKGVALTSYQLRVTLYRKHGTSAIPTVRSVGAIASALPDDKSVRRRPTRRRRRDHARRSAVLAGGSSGRIPGLRRRRGGLVQPDVDRDGCRVLGRQAGRVRPQRHPVPGSERRLRRDAHLRLALQRRRQLAVQHRLRELVRARGRGRAVALPDRGGAIHQAGHPAGRLGCVQEERARQRRATARTGT